MRALPPNAIPMVGRRYGQLVVLAEAERAPPDANGQRCRQVRVRCDCGNEYVARADQIRRTVRRCRQCADRLCADAGRAMSTRLPSGRTLVEVAAASGVALNTVTQRWCRGWSEEDLGRPRRTGRAPRAEDAMRAEEAIFAGVPAFARPAAAREHARPHGEADASAAAAQQPAWRPPDRLPRCVPAFAAALFLACAPAPAPCPPLRDVSAQLERIERAAVRGAELAVAARRLDAAERALLVAPTPRARRAARAEWLDARHQLRALAREGEPR